MAKVLAKNVGPKDSGEAAHEDKPRKQKNSWKEALKYLPNYRTRFTRKINGRYCEHNFTERAFAIASQLLQVHPVVMASLALLRLGEKFLPSRPIALFLVVISVAFVLMSHRSKKYGLGGARTHNQPRKLSRLSGLLESSWKRGWTKISEHRDRQLRVLLALQLSLKAASLCDRFEFQHGDGFQVLAQSLGCVGTPAAMLGKSPF
jgi:hypothetical protein